MTAPPRRGRRRSETCCRPCSLPVFAHGLVGRADLPIPKALFAAAAAAVLVVSFVALASLWSTPRLQEPRERRLFRLPLAVDAVLGVVGVVAFGAVVYAGLAGTDSEQDNLAPTAIFVILWVGVPFASLLFGDVFRLLSPWRAIGRAVGWVVARVAPAEPLDYPERLGRRPAAAGILFFGVVELCWARRARAADARDPRAASTSSSRSWA